MQPCAESPERRMTNSVFSLLCRRYTTRIMIPRAILIEGHKYRTPGGNIYPSVTTILSKTRNTESIRQWRDDIGHSVADYILQQAGIIGTETHQLNEDYLCGRPQYTSKLLARAHHENFKPYLNKITNILGTELPLYSDMLGVAGTADCIAAYDGTLSIIDYKTKRTAQQPDWITDYYIQTTAYGIMLEELAGITIRQGVILVSSEQDTIQEFILDVTPYRVQFLARLEQYNRNL